MSVGSAPYKTVEKRDIESQHQRGHRVPAPKETRRSQHYQRLLSLGTTRDWKISMVEAADCLERTQ